MKVYLTKDHLDYYTKLKDYLTTIDLFDYNKVENVKLLDLAKAFPDIKYSYWYKFFTEVGITVYDNAYVRSKDVVSNILFIEKMSSLKDRFSHEVTEEVLNGDYSSSIRYI